MARARSGVESANRISLQIEKIGAPDRIYAPYEVEALVLERLEIPRADMRIRVDLGKLDPAANRASRRQLPIA
jgi:hypothetical protein